MRNCNRVFCRCCSLRMTGIGSFLRKAKIASPVNGLYMKFKRKNHPICMSLVNSKASQKNLRRFLYSRKIAAHTNPMRWWSKVFSQHELDNFRDLEMRVTHLSPGDKQQGRQMACPLYFRRFFMYYRYVSFLSQSTARLRDKTAPSKNWRGCMKYLLIA